MASKNDLRTKEARNELSSITRAISCLSEMSSRTKSVRVQLRIHHMTLHCIQLVALALKRSKLSHLRIDTYCRGRRCLLLFCGILIPRYASGSVHCAVRETDLRPWLKGIR